MSDSPENNDTSASEDGQRDVLSSLPRRRPQRLTARREATRKAQGGAKASAGKPSSQARKRSPAKASGGRQQAAAAPRPSVSPFQERAPKQGFDSEEQRPGGGGPQLLAPALRLLGGLAQDGVVRGARLLGTLIQRAPRI